MSRTEGLLVSAVLILFGLGQCSWAVYQHVETKRRGQNVIELCEIIERKFHERCTLQLPPKSEPLQR